MLETTVNHTLVHRTSGCLKGLTAECCSVLHWRQVGSISSCFGSRSVESSLTLLLTAVMNSSPALFPVTICPLGLLQQAPTGCVFYIHMLSKAPYHERLVWVVPNKRSLYLVSATVLKRSNVQDFCPLDCICWCGSVGVSLRGPCVWRAVNPRWSVCRKTKLLCFFCYYHAAPARVCLSSSLHYNSIKPGWVVRTD